MIISPTADDVDTCIGSLEISLMVDAERARLRRLTGHGKQWLFEVALLVAIAGIYAAIGYGLGKWAGWL